MLKNLKSNPPSQKSKKQLDFEADLRSNTKELLMEFHQFSKKELNYILELCEYDLSLSQVYLRKTSKSKVRTTINNMLTGKIEPSLEALGLLPQSLNSKSNLKDGVKEESKELETKQEVEVFVPTGPNFFETKVTSEVVRYILNFLDPVSLGQAGFTCKSFHKISVHPRLFKKFCKKLYPQYPPLPLSSPFNFMLKLINNAPAGEFHPRLIEKANQDIRSLIWLPNVNSFYTPSSYYKQFDSMRSVFLNAARVRFGGVYMMKEKYIRSGTKELTAFYDPYHVVEFFRYFRFLPDGLVISCLCVNKLRKDKLTKIFSPESHLLEEGAELFSQNSIIKNVLQGEYIVQKSKIHVKLMAKSTIYEYELEIGSSEPGLFDQLQMLTQSMKPIEAENSELLQNNNMGSKVFKFVKVPEFIPELSSDIASVAS